MGIVREKRADKRSHMRILQVINSLNTGGAEKLLLDAIPKYREKGIDMDLLVLNDFDFPFLQNLKESTNCKIYILTKGSIYNPLIIIKLRRYLKMYDIIHAHLFPTLYWVAFSKITFGLTQVLLFTEHSTSNNRRKYFIFQRIDGIAYRMFDRIITISKDVDESLKRHIKLDKNRFLLIPNGVSLESIDGAMPYNKQDIGLNCSDIIVMQVSSFRKPKDQETLIRAIPLVKLPIKVILVGEGNTMAECKRLVKKLDLKEKVLFYGERMDVPRLLKTASLVVLSTKFEGMSLSCIEGLASGNPFIASSAPGIESMVKDAGVIFPIGDASALAKVIDELLSNESYYNEVKSRCMKKARQFGLANMINSHINLYQDLWQNQN